MRQAGYFENVVVHQKHFQTNVPQDSCIGSIFVSVLGRSAELFAAQDLAVPLCVDDF